MQSITILKPDDWHVHFRDGEILTDTVNATASSFARALVMPNLKPALTSLEALLDYRQRILNALTANTDFTPMMTFYLNEQVSADQLAAAKPYPYIVGAKLYPAGATTNSEEGAQSLKALYPLFEAMQQLNLVLQIHGEVTHSDIFERETLFLTEYLQPIINHFPRLRIVLEHISTKAAVDFISQAPNNVGATITPHHLLYNRNHLLAGGIKPHYYCLPILKHASDQKALQEAATSGNPKFFAGTDSAPHAKHAKESACGCAGVYSAPYALAMYTQVFADADKLQHLNHFMSHFGAEFYQVDKNKEEITLIKQAQHIPAELSLGNDIVIPAAAGEDLPWSIYASA